MTYQLGIDLGTTFSTAAVLRDGRVEVLTLGTRSSAVPTVVFVREDGAVLVGEAAEARGVGEPDRLAREFKRRLGDPTPLVLGGAPYGAERLAAYVLEHIVVRASERMGGPPDSVVVTHPASYSAYRLDLLREATVLAGCRDAVLLPEPQAAAWHYAHDHRIERDETIAVFDFGGGTLDTAVVRAVSGGFEMLGEPQGLDRFGGIDIDDAVFEHVREQVDDLFPERDEQIAEPAWRSALARLRIECRTAKERLSDDVETVIAVATPSGSQQVPLRRWQLEAMVRPRVGDAVRALERAIESAGLTMADISRVLLVGGTSRIPLVRVMLAEATGRQIALDADPETTIALGAARWNPRVTEPRLAPPPVGAPAVDAPPPPPPSPSPSPSSSSSAVVSGSADEPPRRQLPPTIPPEPESSGGPPTMRPDGVPIAPHTASTTGPTRTRPSRRRRYLVGGMVAAVAAVGVGIAVTRSDDEPADPVAELSAACADLADATADAVLPTTVDEAREFSNDFGPAFDRALERIEPIVFTDETEAVNHQLLVESLRALGQSVDLLGDATVDDVVVYATDVASGTDNVNGITSDVGVRDDCIPRSLAEAPAAAATTVPPTEPPTTVPVTTAAPTTVAPTTVPPTEPPTTVPITAVPGVIQAVDLGQFFVGPDGFSLAPFADDTLQTNVVDSWQTDPAAGPALSFIYGARILDGAGVEVGQAFVFVGNQPLADTPAGTRIVNEFVTAPAAVTTEPYTSGVFPGTLFTLQSGTNGWVSALGNSVTLVFGTGDQVRGLVDGFVAANVGRSLPGLP